MHISLFAKEPFLDHNNTQSYKARIPFEGFQVCIVHFVSKARHQLIVYPPEIELTQNQFESRYELMLNRAKKIVAFLTKYGGWVLEEPVLKGVIELAFTKKGLRPHLPVIRKTKDSELWTDNSHSELEVETHKNLIADWLVNFPKAVDRIEATQRDHSARLTSVEDMLKLQGSAISRLIQINQQRAGSEQSTADDYQNEPYTPKTEVDIEDRVMYQ